MSGGRPKIRLVLGFLNAGRQIPFLDVGRTTHKDGIRSPFQPMVPLCHKTHRFHNTKRFSKRTGSRSGKNISQIRILSGQSLGGGG
jgi:hypothetical protein